MERISTSYLEYMTDDFSIWQHSNGIKIDKKHGYALDDGARALILVLTYGPRTLAPIYFNFLKESIKDGKFTNFYGKDRKPLDSTRSEDAIGQTYWALTLWNQFYQADKYKLERIEEVISNFISTRGIAYSLIGASLSKSRLADKLFSRLYQQYLRIATPTWHWIDDSLTYGNAIIPMSFLSFYQFSNDPMALKKGLLMLDFLNLETKKDGVPIAIGCKGWYSKDSRKALFDQQPIDIAYQVISNIKAYEILDNNNYLKEAYTYFTWFWGNNLLSRTIIDPRNQRCLDGLKSKSVSKNCGAESIICYLWAQEIIWPYLEKIRTKMPVYLNKTLESSTGDILTNHGV